MDRADAAWKWLVGVSLSYVLDLPSVAFVVKEKYSGQQ